MSTISVTNLHFKVTVDDLYDCFSQVGELSECRLILSERNETRGFAFITFKKPNDANRALDQLSDFKFYGRPIKLNYSKPSKYEYQ